MEPFKVGEIVQVRDGGWHRGEYGVVLRVDGDMVRVQTLSGTFDEPAAFVVNEKLSGFNWVPSDDIRRLAARVASGGMNDTFAAPDSAAPDDPLQTGKAA